MNEFQLSRKLLSAYYMSVLVFISIISVFKDFIQYLTTIFAGLLYSIVNIKVDGTDNIWWALFLVSFGVVVIIKQTAITPLGFYVNEESNVNWEKWILAVLVMGCLIYNLNILFPEYLMPQVVPNFIVKLVDGSKAGLSVSSSSDRVITNLVAPILWNVGPIILMWIMHLKSKLN
ncbi:MAG: hypothetical protein H7196_00195 [candidate division SR1 bacterium]|nr:hypothetical protein [candidate division SR1 bacterium]